MRLPYGQGRVIESTGGPRVDTFITLLALRVTPGNEDERQR